MLDGGVPSAGASSPLEARCNLRGKCLAEYVFLGGSGGDLRSRTRVLDHVPASAAECPLWTVDGSSTDQVREQWQDGHFGYLQVFACTMGVCNLGR